MAVITYKCPNCGGELTFQPTTQKYRCEYCASAFSQEELEKMQPAAGVPGQGEGDRPARGSDGQAAREGVPSGETVWSGMPGQGEADRPARGSDGQAAQAGGREYYCPSCGAQIVTDETTAASFCYYCHNPVVLSGQVSGEFLPDKIIPFAIDQKQATERFLSYVRGKRFVPRAFFDKSQIEKISGVYFPYWMVDLDLEGGLRAEGRNIRVWRSGDTEYTETSVFDVERAGEIHLEDISRNALKKANRKLAERVLPYDAEKMQPFHMGYLSGFLAERRDIEREELEAGVRTEAKDYGERLLVDTVHGYSSVSVRDCRLDFRKENWDYALLPVWTVTYKGKDGKMYYYSMNGQTGNVSGELPIDYKKVGLLGLAVFLAVFLLGLTGGYFL